MSDVIEIAQITATVAGESPLPRKEYTVEMQRGVNKNNKETYS